MAIANSASSLLTVDLAAIAANYKTLCKLSLPAETAAVVKANAYGLGIEHVAKTLDAAGAKTFFVATLDEAIELRKHTRQKILTLNGFFKGAEDLYAEYGITPVLNSLEEIARYDFAAAPVWQVDTGMNRLGLHGNEIEQAFAIAHSKPYLVMSHLVSSENPFDDMNARQLKSFQKIARACWTKDKDLQFSLANSGGVFLGNDYHFDLTRPGLALYGANPTTGENPMQHVLKLETRILQIHEAKKGESAGYNATYVFERDSRVAIVSFGYADGLPRTGSNSAKLYWQGPNGPMACPVLGRVSMDLIIVDVTRLPALPAAGDWLEIIGPNQSLETLAKDCGTISYELLTSLSRRAKCIYNAQL